MSVRKLNSNDHQGGEQMFGDINRTCCRKRLDAITSRLESVLDRASTFRQTIYNKDQWTHAIAPIGNTQQFGLLVTNANGMSGHENCAGLRAGSPHLPFCVSNDEANPRQSPRHTPKVY